MKVNVTIDDALLTRIDSYAEEHYLTRSGFLALAADKYLQAVTAYPAVQTYMSDLFTALADCVSTGSVDPERIESLSSQLETIKSY